MKKFFLIFTIFFFISCSKEEPKSLPPLEKVDLPKEVFGLYSGMLPCENCKGRMIKLELKEDSTLVVFQTVLKDTLEKDSLSGTFSISKDVLSIRLNESKEQWNFKQGSFGSFVLLTGAGTVYEDKDGMKAEIIKIYNGVKTSLDSNKVSEVK